MDSRSQGRGRRQQGPGSREQGQLGQARPHSSQGKDRQHRHSEAGQAMGRAQGQAAGRHSRSGTHATHSRQSHTARRASEAAEGRGRPGARQHGAQVQRTTLLNMRHTETSNCAIVVAWQESERGRARQGSTPAHQLVERDSREAVSFVLPSDAYASRPPGQRGAT